MNVTEVPPSLDHCNDSSTSATEYDIWQQVLISVLAIGLSLVTVIGNSMVMIAIRIDKQLQTISNNFLFSLAVADFAIGLISMPLFTVYTVFGYWPFGSIVCDTWLALDYLASNASVLNLLIISFDRFFSVTRPLTYRAKRTPRKAGIMIAGAWGISVLLWPPWIYAWPYIEGERTVPPDQCYIQFIETNHYITFGTAIAAFYVPVSVMMLLYWRIWRETEKRIKDLKDLQEGKQDASKRSNSSDEALDMEGCRRGRSASSTGHDDVNSSHFAASYLERRYPDSNKHRPLSWTSLKMWCIAWWHSGREDDDDDDDVTATDVPSKTMYPGDETLTPVSAETPFNSTISRPSLTGLPSSESSQVRKNISGDPVYTIVIKLPPASSAPSITMYEDLISLQDHPKHPPIEHGVEDERMKQPRRIDSVSTMAGGDVRLPLNIKPISKSLTCTNVTNKPQNKKKKRTQDKKAAKILSAILAAFVITWTPYNILVLLKPLTKACIIQIPPELWSFFYYLCYINSTINPLCYALCNANFRRTYWRILQCKWRRNASRAYCPP